MPLRSEHPDLGRRGISEAGRHHGAPARPGGLPVGPRADDRVAAQFVLEETYEVLDAIDRGDHDALRGEIGDFLFEGVFLAQIDADAGHFTVADSLAPSRRS